MQWGGNLEDGAAWDGTFKAKDSFILLVCMHSNNLKFNLPNFCIQIPTVKGFEDSCRIVEDLSRHVAILVKVPILSLHC
jgi:hypothetical protein